MQMGNFTISLSVKLVSNVISHIHFEKLRDEPVRKSRDLCFRHDMINY